MVHFRVCLSLHNFTDAHKNNITKNQTKAKHILNFYKVLGKKIAFMYNSDIKMTREHLPDYYEPLVKVRKNILVFRESKDEDNEALTHLVKQLFPPSIELDFECIMNEEDEEMAVKEFRKHIRKTLKGTEKITSYRALKDLYYSTKITNFIKNLNSVIIKNELWEIYKDKYDIKTKYVPRITVGDTTVLSLS